MNEFIKTPTKGQLFIDKVLFESNIPILFVCNNAEDELFLCVCCQSNSKGRKWLISSVNEEIIIKMLSDEISLRDAFLADDSFRLSAQRTKDSFSIGYNEEDWKEGSIYLPKKDEYMEAEEGEFDEEIDYYKLRILRKDCKYSFERIFEESELLSSLDPYSIDVNSCALLDYGSLRFEGEITETIKDAVLASEATSYMSSLLNGLYINEYNQVDQYLLSGESVVQELIEDAAFLLAA